MDETAWQELVRKLEPKARSHPAAYRWRVVAFATLGYALVGAVVVALVTLAVGIAVMASHQAAGLISFEIPVLAMLGAVLQAFYVKTEPSDGQALSRADARELFEMIEEVRRKVRGPRVHEVVLDRDLNAGIVQNPPAGGLLGSRNYLVIGLPCLAALSADEFRAVVAHELGHLSSKHGRFGTFVYRVCTRWTQLLASLEERKSRWSGPARLFARWYTPTFEAHALPLIRAHELEADDAAAAASGRPATATALVSLDMASRWLDESYWPTVYGRVIDEPEPPRTAFAPMTRAIAEARQVPGLELWYRDLLAVETGAADTHPSLAERLAHLGMDPHTVLALAKRNGKASAASHYLGDGEARLTDELDREWRDAVVTEWRERYKEAQKDRARLAQLDARDSLSADARLSRAQLTETFRGPERALERYRELLGGENDPYARFAVGRLLLADDDEEGLQWLEEAMMGAPDAVLPACDLGRAFLHTRGRDDEARVFIER
jgi:Zn-dependent protease with chaperone function